ncbi:FecR family protein [Aestuariivirga litoralis]|uniref:FecR family protein n=1 Tax=Aestuariivirga litoralis TaxID=2650924 RepID=UPI0018C76AF8|nr:FecR domain-containing protein [Aestuariivirga litoralis]MBG1231282.1 hypothetical protein [Aestuariivirga litoralis]
MQFRSFVVSIALFFASAGFAEAAAIAKVAGLYGSPTANGRVLSVGAQVQEHDKIAVSSGNVQLLFTDGTKLVVGANSTLVIEKYLMKGNNSVSSFTVDALRGTFRFITGSSAKAAYDIQTANATIGIRGTGFDFWVDKNTGVVVLEGKVRLCRKGSNACVDINPNCQAGIAEPGKARKLSNSELATRASIHLPYLQSQAFLRQAFKLNTSSCRDKLTVIEGGGLQQNPTSPRQQDR